MQKSNFFKPKVVISKCINIEATRYNGGIIVDEFTKKLGEFVEYIPLCPEVEIGLPAPRSPLILVKGKGQEPSIIQPATGIDYTQRMLDYANRVLAPMKNIDGFILKGKSPSCGISNTTIYESVESYPEVRGKGRGIFAYQVFKRFEGVVPIEDEGRLKNPDIRHHFLTAIFSLAEFRNLKEKPRSRDLVEFHSQHKYLLMAVSESRLRSMGKIVSRAGSEPLEDVIKQYEVEFRAAFRKMPSRNHFFNTLLHIYGYFSDRLNALEKAHFLDILEGFRSGKVPMSLPVEILRSYVYRFNEEYLLKQRFFNPYPEELSV